jgi:hypothetical protein
MTTYTSLLTTVGNAGKFPPLDAREATEDYLKRLVLGVSSLPIETYNAMTDDQRQWFDNAADALSAGMRIPLPEGFDREALLSPSPPPPVRIMRPTAAVRPTIPPPAVTPTLAPAPAPPLVRGDEPVRDVIVKLMVAQPDLSAEALIRKLANYQIRITTENAATQRSFALTVLRILREAGWRPPHAVA